MCDLLLIICLSVIIASYKFSCDIYNEKRKIKTYEEIIKMQDSQFF